MTAYIYYRLWDLRISTPIYLLLLLSFLPIYLKAEDNPTQSKSSDCILYFGQDCVFNQISNISFLKTSDDLNQPPEEMLFEIARLTTEIYLPKKIQNKTWPYLYRDKRVESVNKLITLPIFSAINEQILKHNLILKKLISKGHNYSFSFKECFSLSQENFNDFITSAYCSSPQMLNEHLLHTDPRLKNLSNDQKIILFKHIYADEVELSYLGAAKDTASQLVFLSAGTDSKLQIDTSLFLARTLLEYGHPQNALDEINSITPNTKNAMSTLDILEFYRNYANFLIEAASTLKEKPTTKLEPEKATRVLELHSYNPILEYIDKQDKLTQLEIHFMILKSIFYSDFFNDAAGNLVFAYHTNEWSDIFKSLQGLEKATHGIEFIHFELKVSTYLDHQLLNIKTRPRNQTFRPSNPKTDLKY